MHYPCYKFYKISQFKYSDIEFFTGEEYPKDWEYFLNRYHYNIDISWNFFKFYNMDNPLKKFLQSKFYCYGRDQDIKIQKFESIKIKDNIFYDVIPYNDNGTGIIFKFKYSNNTIVKLPDYLFTMGL